MTTVPHFPYEKNDGKKPKLILFGGFPDNETSSWGTAVPEALSKTYDLYFICLPGYEKGGKVEGWGYPLDDIVDRMHYTIQKIFGENQPAPIVSHDWGAVVSLMYQTKYPETVSRLVLIDVGMINPANVGIKTIFYMTIYQVWFAICFLLSRFLGVVIGSVLMNFFFLPIFAPLWPCTDAPPIPREEVSVDKCYPYYQVWAGLLQGKPPKQKFPKCPTLFLVSSMLL